MSLIKLTTNKGVQGYIQEPVFVETSQIIAIESLCRRDRWDENSTLITLSTGKEIAVREDAWTVKQLIPGKAEA